MNTLMQQTAKFLPQTLVKGLPSVSRGFSFSNSLLWLSEDQAWREAKNAKQYAYQKKKMADPSWKEATLKRMRLFHRQRYQDKEFSGRKRFRNWVHSSDICATLYKLIGCLAYKPLQGATPRRSCVEDTCSNTVQRQSQAHLCWLWLSSAWRIEALV